MKKICGETALLSNSLWLNTMSDARPFPKLSSSRKANVCVIGGGFTGLSTALHLAERNHKVIVLESHQPGWGASGRNGGQVIPGIKIAPGVLEKSYGERRAWEMLHAALGSSDYTFSLISRLGIECDARRKGWIQGAINSRLYNRLESRAKSQEGRALGYSLLSAAEMLEITGTSAYVGGMLIKQAGLVHPLKLAVGLARAVCDSGGEIFGSTRALSVSGSNGDFCIKTPGGEVRADKVVVAGNGYFDHAFPILKRSVVPVISLQVGSEPLPADVDKDVLPSGVAVSDIRALTYYFHKDVGGRLLFGGRGSFKASQNKRLIVSLQRGIEELFPQIKGYVKWRYNWGGRVAMTPSHVPQLIELEPGCFSAFGYSGRGVAMAVLMGKYTADLIDCVEPDNVPFPVTKPNPIPLHRFNRIGVAATVSYYRFRDRLDAWRF